MLIDLTQMKPGESGVVNEITSGHDAAKRIQNMGIIPGKGIRKVSSHFWRGPQTVNIGKLQIAVGFGMARKIIIEVDR
ncbi:MAG: ferrous iron transport protein A [Candidatus Omnitrophica bacterium]|nr:ferrous iron transport protein A [Candidatus Omnitrophota bacterium]